MVVGSREANERGSESACFMQNGITSRTKTLIVRPRDLRDSGESHTKSIQNEPKRKVPIFLMTEKCHDEAHQNYFKDVCRFQWCPSVSDETYPVWHH
jgi:hypothetical protein